MSINGTISEEVSQPISESYAHLSQDDISGYSEWSSGNESSDALVHDTTLLMRLARAIDKQHRKTGKTTNELGGVSPPSEVGKSKKAGFSDKRVGRAKKTRRPHLDLKADASTFFSSHSTPILKHGSASDRLEGEEKQQPKKIDESKDNNSKLKKLDLQELMASFSSNELKDIKNLVDTMIENKPNSSSNVTKHPLVHTMYSTPKDSYSTSLNCYSSSSGDDDDDKLSLTGARTPSAAATKQKRKSGPTKDNLQKIDDNIEREKNKVQEFDSPTTTPPHSQEYAEKEILLQGNIDSTTNVFNTRGNYMDTTEINTSYFPKRFNPKYRFKSKENVLLTPGQPTPVGGSNLLAPPKADQELERLEKENLDLKIKVNELEIKLSEIESRRLIDNDLGVPEVSFVEPAYESNASNDKVNELTLANRQLNLQLSNSKTHIQELTNEINFLKKSVETSSAMRQLVDANTSLKDQVSSLQLEVGDKSQHITENTVLPEFKEYYQKLQLNKVNTLSKVDLSNLIKNVMLSLLITDFDHLPMVSTKIGKFFKVFTLFVDLLHGIVYNDSPTSMKPSQYLKNHEFGMQELQSCLDGILENLNPPEDH